MIPFIDLRKQYSRIEKDVDQAIKKVLLHGQYILGPEVAELERKLADFAGTKYCLGCSSGTDALLMAMMAMDFKKGDAVFTTPFNFWLYGNLYLRFADIASEVPHLSIPLWDVFKTIVILLGIPLVLGVMTSHYLPRVAQKLKKPLQWFSILFFIAMVVLSFMGNLDAFLKCIKYIFLVVLLHNLLALAIGWCVGSACRVPRRDRRTLTIETGIQNSGLGLVLLLGTSIFADFPPHGGTLVITAWWGVWHIVSGLAVSTMFYLSDRRQSQKR